MDQSRLTTGRMAAGRRINPSSAREAVSAYLSLFSSLATVFCIPQHFYPAPEPNLAAHLHTGL
jgi:hypothetical protein